MNASLSDLDLARFGVVTAKCDDLETLADVDDCFSFCASHDVKFLIVRIPSDRFDLAQKVEQSGGYICDTLIYYRRSLIGERPAISESTSMMTRAYVPADRTRVLEIARESFTGYFGHYHSDPKLNKADCDETYVSWCENTINGLSAQHHIIVVENEEGVCGFLTVRIHSDARLELVLSGVATRAQGQGAYRRLIEAGIQMGFDLKLKRVFTSTQVPNIAVQKTWASLGFTPFKSTYTFHAWL